MFLQNRPACGRAGVRVHDQNAPVEDFAPALGDEGSDMAARHEKPFAGQCAEGSLRRTDGDAEFPREVAHRLHHGARRVEARLDCEAHCGIELRPHGSPVTALSSWDFRNVVKHVEMIV